MKQAIPLLQIAALFILVGCSSPPRFVLISELHETYHGPFGATNGEVISVPSGTYRVEVIRGTRDIPLAIAKAAFYEIDFQKADVRDAVAFLSGVSHEGMPGSGPVARADVVLLLEDEEARQLPPITLGPAKMSVYSAAMAVAELAGLRLKYEYPNLVLMK